MTLRLRSTQLNLLRESGVDLRAIRWQKAVESNKIVNIDHAYQTDNAETVTQRLDKMGGETAEESISETAVRPQPLQEDAYGEAHAVEPSSSQVYRSEAKSAVLEAPCVAPQEISPPAPPVEEASDTLDKDTPETTEALSLGAPAEDSTTKPTGSTPVADAAFNGFGQSHKPNLLVVLNSASARRRRNGELLSGRAGNMFLKILSAIGIDESNGYFCLESADATPPSTNERQDRAGLYALIEAAQPNIVLTLGESATQTIIGTSEPLERLRNVTHTLDNGIKVRASYHPLDLLERPANKARAWNDIYAVLGLIYP